MQFHIECPLKSRYTKRIREKRMVIACMKHMQVLKD